MPLQYDLGVDANNDLDIVDNDTTYVLSDQQHIEDTIKAYPLWWKEFPSDGVGINSYRNSSGKMQQLARDIKLNLQDDGYDCDNPTIVADPGGSFSITTNAERL